MKKNRRISLVGTLCGIALALSLLVSGCSIGGKEVVVSEAMTNRQLFKIGTTTCSLKEAKVYLVNYQNIYGTAYGLNLWEHDFGDDSLKDYVKNITMQELTQVISMDQLAKSRELELSEEEKNQMAQAAEEYFASLTEEEKEYMGVSESDIRDYYEHYALAQKLYTSLTGAVNEEVSDDEARVMELMQIYVSDSTKADEVAAKLAAGEDFASVANNYNEAGSIQITASRDDLPAEVSAAAFQMDNDQMSGKIEAENGFYFVKCLNKYNQELTEANKTNIVEKREKEAVDDVYNEYTESLTSSINEKVWNALEPETGSGMQTDSFFETFHHYWNLQE